MNKMMLPVGLAIMTLALTSCNNEGLNIIEKTSSSFSNLANQTSATGTTNIGDYNNESGTKTSPDYTIIDNTLASPDTDITDTVEAVYDSVVAITATSTTAISAGSGVLFASDESLGLSYVVTCFHVIDDASLFSVTLADGSNYDAKLIGGYEDLDIAVMSIEETEGLTYAPFYDDSDKLKLGSGVVCIGNPLGSLPGSVSTGIISYINRKVQIDNYNYRTLIQTDVAINSGNSGGALFNTKGALIGIVNAKYSSSGIEGLGFAIPINQVKYSIENLLSTARYDIDNKTWTTGYVEGDISFGFEISEGYYHSGFQSKRVFYISDVSTNITGTGSSELKYQDIISSIAINYKDSSKTSINITTFSSSTDLYNFLYGADLEIGDTIVFKLIRNSSEIEVKVPVIQYIYSI